MTVLLVEDNAFFAQVVEQALHGVRVTVVGTLAAAREVLVDHRFDLVFLDLGLPDSQGVATLRALDWVKVPKVVITASQVAKECAQAGAADYILKGADDIVERIQFNANKVCRASRARFAPETFEQIKACLGLHAPEYFELARMS